jgi:hypothetical protein
MPWAPTVTEELRNDVRFALRFKVGRKQQLTDTERDLVATAIVEHIRLCNWRVERGPPWGGFAELGHDPGPYLLRVDPTPPNRGSIGWRPYYADS